MYIKEIIALIEEYAPLKLQASFDNSGLLCGDPEREFTSVLLCIDVTEEIVNEAIIHGHNLIISHHRVETHYTCHVRGTLRDLRYQT